MPRRLPPRRKTDVSHITGCDTVQKHLIGLYGQLGSWKAVGGEIGVSAAVAQRVAMTDYRPKSPAIRAALKLPILGLGEICPVHHKVCAVKHRTAARKPHHRDLFDWPVKDLAAAMRRLTQTT